MIHFQLLSSPYSDLMSLKYEVLIAEMFKQLRYTLAVTWQDLSLAQQAVVTQDWVAGRQFGTSGLFFFLPSADNHSQDKRLQANQREK